METGEEVWCAAGYTYSQQIVEKAHREKPTKSFEEMIPEPYRKLKQVFSEEASERLLAHKPWDHAIELIPGAPETMHTKVYPMSPLDQFLQDNLCRGYIHPSKSPLASPVFFDKKKDGKLCFVQDYCKLNEFTVKN